jgi:hypothetical protein
VRTVARVSSTPFICSGDMPVAVNHTYKGQDNKVVNAYIISVILGKRSMVGKLPETGHGRNNILGGDNVRYVASR